MSHYGPPTEGVTTPPRKRQPIPKRIRAAIFARDEPKCAACGWRYGDPTRRPRSRPASKGLPFWMLELDHIVPWSQGGESVLENLQILCSGCNASKGARITADLNHDWR